MQSIHGQRKLMHKSNGELSSSQALETGERDRKASSNEKRMAVMEDGGWRVKREEEDDKRANILSL